MMKKFHSFQSANKQEGIGLPAAIFVITLMAGIAVAINLLVQQNAESYIEDLNFTRAFYAAESGAGFAMNSIFPPEEYPTYTSSPRCAMGTSEYNFIVDGINQCSASVTCAFITIGETNYATIESKGTCGDVVRIIQVRTVY